LFLFGDGFAQGAGILAAEGHLHRLGQRDHLRVFTDHVRPGNALQDVPLPPAGEDKSEQDNKKRQPPHVELIEELWRINKTLAVEAPVRSFRKVPGRQLIEKPRTPMGLRKAALCPQFSDDHDAAVTCLDEANFKMALEGPRDERPKREMLLGDILDDDPSVVPDQAERDFEEVDVGFGSMQAVVDHQIEAVGWEMRGQRPERRCLELVDIVSGDPLVRKKNPLVDIGAKHRGLGRPVAKPTQGRAGPAVRSHVGGDVGMVCAEPDLQDLQPGVPFAAKDEFVDEVVVVDGRFVGAVGAEKLRQIAAIPILGGETKASSFSTLSGA
jgi:hypothetical protein